MIEPLMPDGGVGPDSDRVLDADESLSLKALKDLPKDVPIYRDLRRVEAAKYHGWTTLTGHSKDAADTVFTFYADALIGNGWTKAETNHDSRDDAGLSFTKDGRQLHIYISAKQGHFASTVMLLHSDAGASAAARRAAADPDMPEAREAMDRMVKAYAECKSYHDKGLVKQTITEKRSTRTDQIPFTTAFVRPDRFRFEYRDRFSPSAPWSCHIIHSDALGIHIWEEPGTPGVAQRKSLELTIAGFTGVSGGSAHTVPSLLLPIESSGGVAHLFQLKLLPDEDLDGSACYRIDGLNNLGEVGSLWIDRQTMLLRRVDKFITSSDFRGELVTTYEPEVDITIPEEELDFAPPTSG